MKIYTERQIELIKELAEWMLINEDGFPYLNPEAPQEVVDKYNELYPNKPDTITNK